MLLLDTLLAFLNSLASPSCLISYTGFRSQFISSSKSILVLVLKSKVGVAPKYLMNHINSTLSATSHRPLQPSDWHVLFVPRVRTAVAQTTLRSFATIWPSLWNALPSSLRLSLLSGSCSTSLSGYPFSTLISTFGVFTLAALLSGVYCERGYTNLEMRYVLTDFVGLNSSLMVCRPKTPQLICHRPILPPSILTSVLSAFLFYFI